MNMSRTMKRIRRAGAIIVAGAGVLSGSVAGDLEITPLEASSTRNVPPLGWVVDPAAETWTTAPVLWEGCSQDITARLWMAASPTGLLCRVVVFDPAQKNDFTERNLWRGDCIYLALDPRGDLPVDGTNAVPAELDDTVFIFGLGSQGPEGRAAQHGKPSERGADKSGLLRGIARDDRACTTTYDICVPWDEVSSAPGQSDTMGLAVTIAHKDAAGQDLNWGRFNPGKAGPRDLHRFALPSGEGPLATLAPRRLRLVADSPAEVVVAVRDPGGAVVSATCGPLRAQRELPGATSSVQRCVVTLPAPAAAGACGSIRVDVQPRTGAPVSREFALGSPSLARERFDAKIDRLLATASSAVISNHLASTRAAVHDAWARLPWERGAHPERAEAFLDRVDLITARLPAERVDGDLHLRRALPFVFAFVSDTDHSLQFYSLQFPFAWQPERQYPLVVYLHGAGDSNPLGGLSTAFDNTHQDTLFRNADIDPTNIPPSHRGFVLAPWARGNSMYRHAGEDDVWQSIDDVRRRFKIDASRMYLTGFSMGCGGAWGLAARTPDLWAGIGLASGFGEWSETSREFLADNAAGVPVNMWIGELDGRLDGAKRFRELLERKKIPHEATFVPNMPHTYPYEHFQACVGWLMEHAPSRTGAFRFTADSARHAGRRGIRMRVPFFPDTSALPFFTCEAGNGVLRIDTRNTTGLELDLADPDLGLSGDVTVIWNGKELYRGPCTTVRLGDRVERWW